MERLRERFHIIQNPSEIIGSIESVINPINDMMESKAYGSADMRSGNYYEQPRIIARATKFKELNIVDALSGIVGSQPVQLSDIQSVRDLERIGTIQNFAAALFWEEINSITTRELDPGNAKRLDIFIDETSPDKRGYLRRLRQLRGNLIHGLRAKDSTGRYAYYHIFIKDSNEESFYEALKSKANLCLEDFGEIVASVYEDNFRHNRQVAAREKFLGIIGRYSQLAQRVKSYSYSDIPNRRQASLNKVGAENDFRISYFNAALRDPGSKAELARLLSEARSFTTEEEASDAPVDGAQWVYWAKANICKSAIEVIEKWKGGLKELHAIASLITKPSQGLISDALAYFRQIMHYVGNPEDTLAAVAKFIIRSSETHSDEALHERIEMLQNITHSEVKIDDEFVFRKPLHTMIDFMFMENRQLGFVTNYICAYAMYNEDSLGEVLLSSRICNALLEVRQSTSHEKDWVIMADIAPYDMRRAFVIERNLLDATLIYKLGDPRRKVLEFLFVDDILDYIRSISVFGEFINSLEEHRRIALISGLLERSLQPILERVGVDREQWRPFVEDVAQRLLGLTPIDVATVPLITLPGQLETSSNASIETQQHLGPMPTNAELKARGELYSQTYASGRSKNIIQHLQEVWMPWIEAEVLTQPELSKPDRDPSAYKALLVWRSKRGNDLRAALGYNIPSKSDLVDADLAAAALLPPGERPAKLGWAVRQRALRGKLTER